jgi:hypothetical protein
LKEKNLAYSINKEEIFVLWKSIQEWEEFIYNAANKHHRIETIETLEYIINDEDNITEEFYNMDKDLLVMILQGLEKKNKCMVNINSNKQLLTDDNNRYIGVKFLK